MSVSVRLKTGAAMATGLRAGTSTVTGRRDREAGAEGQSEAGAIALYF